jgi:hypothetical protein
VADQRPVRGYPPHSWIDGPGPILRAVGKKPLTVPDEYATAAVDVSAWLDQKWAAIRSHRSQLEGERPLPALLSRLDHERRSRVLSTEYFTRHSSSRTRSISGIDFNCPFLKACWKNKPLNNPRGEPSRRTRSQPRRDIRTDNRAGKDDEGVPARLRGRCPIHAC